MDDELTLGAFSISLAVDDLERSRVFYEALGFAVTGGSEDEQYLMLRNHEGHLIGLFHGMFEGNILTFNPKLGQDMARHDDGTDVRAIQARLEAAGIELDERVATDEGAGHLALVDPDGNAILIDQFW